MEKKTIEEGNKVLIKPFYYAKDGKCYLTIPNLMVNVPGSQILDEQYSNRYGKVTRVIETENNKRRYRLDIDDGHFIWPDEMLYPIDDAPSEMMDFIEYRVKKMQETPEEPEDKDNKFECPEPEPSCFESALSEMMEIFKKHIYINVIDGREEESVVLLENMGGLNKDNLTGFESKVYYLHPVTFKICYPKDEIEYNMCVDFLTTYYKEVRLPEEQYIIIIDGKVYPDIYMSKHIAYIAAETVRETGKTVKVKKLVDIG